MRCWYYLKTLGNSLNIWWNLLNIWWSFLNRWWNFWNIFHHIIQRFHHRLHHRKKWFHHIFKIFPYIFNIFHHIFNIYFLNKWQNSNWIKAEMAIFCNIQIKIQAQNNFSEIFFKFNFLNAMQKVIINWIAFHFLSSSYQNVAFCRWVPFGEYYCFAK